MISDDIIIKSVKDGHIKDFENIIHRYEKKILNFIYRMTYNKEDAENLTQETFLKVFKNILTYDCNGKFSAFIFRIARNLTINYVKREKRKTNFSHFFSTNHEDKYLINLNTPSKKTEEEEKLTQVKKYLLELSNNQRIALAYKFSYNYSYKDISKITGWSISKIETLIHRAKKKLIDKIKMQENINKTVLNKGE